MKEDEARGFRLGLLGSGAEHKGKEISAAEFDELGEFAASYGVAEGIEPRVMGDLAGVFGGLKDWKKAEAEGRIAPGAQAETAAGEMGAVFKVMQRGMGENSHMAKEFTSAAASSLTEDKVTGTFTDPNELAAMLSVAAERNTNDEEMQIRAIRKGVRDFEGKPGKLLKEGGIGPKTTMMDAMKRLAPVVRKKADESGRKVVDVLSDYFEDERTRFGIEVQINKGVAGGLYADREKVAAESGGFKSFKAEIDTFRGTTTGAKREASADVALETASRASVNSEVDVMRTRALAGLIRRREIDTNAVGVQDYLKNRESWGALGAGDAKRIDTEAFEMMRQAAPGKSLEMPGIDLTDEGRASTMRDRLQFLRNQGVNPMTGVLSDPRRAAAEPSGGLGMSIPDPVPMLTNIYNALTAREPINTRPSEMSGIPAPLIPNPRALAR
jgi:hypothetical protein